MSDKQHAPAGRAGRRSAGDVSAFLERLEHPHKAAIETIRAAILGADARIRESIKWNAPSFTLGEHFATFKLRPVETVQIVFHTGAKVQPTPKAMAIDDPAGLLRWAAPDRCIVTFSDEAEVRSKQAALVAIVQQWIEQL